MDSDNDEEEQVWRGVPGSIILINLYDPNNVKTYKAAYEATCLMIKQCLRLSSGNYVGISLYGVEETNSSSFGLKSVVDILPLSVPNVDDLEQKILKTDLSGYKQSRDLILSDVLWHCSKIFANCKKQLTARTVIILSKFDIPPLVSDQKPTLKRVVDLVDANIDIKIVNISSNDYEVDPFYENFLIEVNKGKEITIPKNVSNTKEILKLIFQQSNRHLAVARLSFEISSGLSIGVGIYNLLKTQTQHKKVPLIGESNTIVTSVNKITKVVPDDNAMDVDGDELKSKQVPLIKSELLYYQMFGGERIEFTDTEMKTLKNPFGPPTLKLLGFKPANLISKERWFFKPCYFLFPNESIIEGSTVAFKALYQACIEMNTVAICVMCTRVNSRPINVALCPSCYPLGLDVDVGFDVIPIPFIENLRDIPVDDDDVVEAVSDAHKILMKDIIQGAKFHYKPDMFENPKTQCEFRAIEAVALDAQDIEPFVDSTVPDENFFQNCKDDLFDELFGSFEVVAPKRNFVKTSNIGLSTGNAKRRKRK